MPVLYLSITYTYGVRYPLFQTFIIRKGLKDSVVILKIFITAFFIKLFEIMRPLKIAICLGIAVCCTTVIQAQLLKKLKEKAEKVADKALDKKVDDATGTGNNNGTNNSGGTNGSNQPKYGKPSNKGGQGLVSAPPDVNENLTSAETAFKANNLSDARYSVQQAMLGVELQIGQEILKSLPQVVANLKKDSMQDQVTSTGWGWAGLTIQRVYVTGDKQFTVTVANNSLWLSAINMYLANGGYAQNTGGQQNWKQIKVKGYKAVIEYNESTGYKVSVPVGQSSILIYEGINFANEQDMMSAVNQIDIDGIKKHLGEK